MTSFLKIVHDIFKYVRFKDEILLNDKFNTRTSQIRYLSIVFVDWSDFNTRAVAYNCYI